MFIVVFIHLFCLKQVPLPTSLVSSNSLLNFLGVQPQDPSKQWNKWTNQFSLPKSEDILQKKYFLSYSSYIAGWNFKGSPGPLDLGTDPQKLWWGVYTFNFQCGIFYVTSPGAQDKFLKSWPVRHRYLIQCNSI